MSLFSTILEKLGIGTAHAAPNAAPDASGAPPAGTPTADAAGSATAAPSALGEVDVTAVLEEKAKSHPGLNWRTSIVDLLKLLDIDSSLTARKELAGELGYSGSTDDSAQMNIWLHKAVLKKLAENGGKVPADLLD